MANLFEKPIAANPMSEFVALPMEFIDRAMERKTQQYNLAKAEIDAQEQSLLQLQYLQGDAPRHHEIQSQYQKELDAIVDNAGGDYGNVQGALDQFTRKLRTEVSPHGELGAQQANFNAAMKMKEAEDKKLSEGKSSEEGYQKFLSTIGQHRTTQTDNGYNTFQGYSSSTIVNPTKFVQDGVDEIVAKYDEAGMKHVDADLIKKNFYNNIAGNSNLLKAFSERIYGKTDAEGKPIQLESYLNSVLDGVISDKQYYQVADLRGPNGKPIVKTPGMVMQDVGQPQLVKGNLNYDAGSSPLLKDFTALFGADSWKAHKDIVSTPSMQKRIKYMEQKSGTTFPEGFRAQRDWLMENFGKDRRGEVSTAGADPVQENAITSQGQLRDPNAAVYDRTGRKLKASEVKEIQGQSKDAQGGNKTSFISNVVSSGGMYPPGTLVMTSHNGEQYFIEPSNPDVINSPEYNNSLIDMASKTNTGVRTVTLRSNLGQIPMGTYEVEHVPGTTNYNLYIGDKLVYRKFTGSDGAIHGVAVNKEN